MPRIDHKISKGIYYNNIQHNIMYKSITYGTIFIIPDTLVPRK